jgi:DNA-binding Lrp family transcriptional regulator
MSGWITLPSRPADRLEHRLRRLLETGGAMQVPALAAQLNANPDEVADILEHWVEKGIVCRLRPVSYEGRDLDFFRLVRPDDSRYEWEQKVLNVGRHRSDSTKRFGRLAWSF